MIIKTFQVKNLYPKKQSFFLLYGENEGLKKEITDIIINNFRENVLKYDSEEIINRHRESKNYLHNLLGFFYYTLISNLSVIIINGCTQSPTVYGMDNFAFLFFTGSLLYIPSTFVALIINLQSNSEALKVAAVSVEKNGLPVPAANITILFFSKCLIALLLI